MINNHQELLNSFTQNKENKGHANRSEFSLFEYESIVQHNFLVNHLTQIGFPPKGRILEVGSSIGCTSFALTVLKNINNITAIEPEKEAYELSVAFSAKYDPDRKIKFINTTVEHLEETELFDYIICNTVLEHTQNPESVLKTMMKLTAPGGMIYISAPNYAIPYEPHIGLFYFFPFLGKKYIKFLAKLLGKNAQFVDHLSLISYRKVIRWIDNIDFDVTNIFWVKVNDKNKLVYSKLLKKIISTPLLGLILLKLVSSLSAYPSIELILKKKG